MYYIETSTLLSLYISEVYSKSSIEFVRDHQSDLHLSSWVITELYSACNRKVRVDGVPLKIIRNTLKVFEEQKDIFTLHSITETVFSRSQIFLSAKHFKINLRSGDALHLACCFENELELVTCDLRMHEAAQTLKISTTLIR
jgi:predicted nucleic acid-binding protein